MKNLKLTAISSLVMLGTMSGCTAVKDANEDYAKALKVSETTVQKAEPRSTVSVNDPSQEGKFANFGHVSRNWVNPNPLPKIEVDAKRSRLPAIFQKNVSFTMPGQVSLVEVLSEMQRANGIKVNLNQDIYDANPTNAEARLVGGNSSSRNGQVVPISVSDFVFRGTLEDALDLLASKANISWKWNGTGVELYRYETRSYNVSLLAGKTTSNTEVTLQSDSSTDSNSSNSSSSGGQNQATATNNSGAGAAGKSDTSSKQGVSRTSTLDSWSDIKNYLISLMSPNGSIAIMESTGLVTVRDTPDAQRKVAEGIKQLNALIGKQIYINVDVYAITRQATDDYGLDWNLAWSSFKNNVKYNTSNGSAGTSKLQVGVLTGPFAGSSVVAQALSTLGKTTVVNQFQVTTLNGQPTPIGNNKKVPYISGIQVQTDQNGNPIQSITTGSVYQGISMSVIPKLQPNGKILLEYAMNLSDVLGFQNFSTGTGANAQTLSLPTTTLKNILQRASLRSGQALVLSGFKQTVSSSNDSGIGSASNKLFGGAQKGDKQDQYLVITVTPYVAQDNDE